MAKSILIISQPFYYLLFLVFKRKWSSTNLAKGVPFSLCSQRPLFGKQPEEYGAWSMEHGAWSMEHGYQYKKKIIDLIFYIDFLGSVDY